MNHQFSDLSDLYWVMVDGMVECTPNLARDPYGSDAIRLIQGILPRLTEVL